MLAEVLTNQAVGSARAAVHANHHRAAYGATPQSAVECISSLVSEVASTMFSFAEQQHQGDDEVASL